MKKSMMIPKVVIRSRNVKKSMMIAKVVIFNCKMGATSALGTAYPSRAAEYTPGFNVVV
jgi:hypothetical protein